MHSVRTVSVVWILCASSYTHRAVCVRGVEMWSAFPFKNTHTESHIDYSHLVKSLTSLSHPFLKDRLDALYVVPLSPTSP